MSNTILVGNLFPSTQMQKVKDKKGKISQTQLIYSYQHSTNILKKCLGIDWKFGRDVSIKN